jgi:hypothetical protein
VLKIFNLNGSSLQIRSKQQTGGASTKQCGTSFELFESQPDTIKQASNTGMHKPQIRIISNTGMQAPSTYHMVWHSYHRAWIEERQFQKKHFLAQDSIFIRTENLAKQLVLVAKGIFKLDVSQGKTLGG